MNISQLTRHVAFPGVKVVKSQSLLAPDFTSTEERIKHVNWSQRKLNDYIYGASYINYMLY